MFRRRSGSLDYPKIAGQDNFRSCANRQRLPKPPLVHDRTSPKVSPPRRSVLRIDKLQRNPFKATARLVAFFLCIGLQIPSGAPAAANARPAHAKWDCSTSLLPDYSPKTKETDVGEGVTYLYVGDRSLHADYGADALFTTPLDGKRGWYMSGLRLGPLNENNGFVQIGISRWERFDYGQHVAVAWAFPHTNDVGYKDTGIMLSENTAHRLGIFVRQGRVDLRVDGRVICSSDVLAFVAAGEPKYFQIRTETGEIGRNSRASVTDIRLKRDADSSSRPYATDCVLHRYGIFWESTGARAFATRGAFYPNETTFFTGIDPAKPPRCVS